MIVGVDSRFPLMSPDSAVFPTIRAAGADVVLAYHLPGCDDSAVVAFRRVVEWSYGGPNDEGLPSHPLWGHGLTYYNFHAVSNDGSTCTRWLATFHDGLFEIQADATDVIAPSVPGRGPSGALDAILGPGTNRVLDEERLRARHLVVRGKL